MKLKSNSQRTITIESKNIKLSNYDPKTKEKVKVKEIRDHEKNRNVGT